MSTVTGEMQNARQDQQQMFSAMIESQRQLVSTILSTQSKETIPTPPPDLNKMGLEELLKLMTETEDGEEYMKIQQVFSVRLKALGAQKKRENNVAKTITPVPKSASTPNNPPLAGDTYSDEKRGNETIVDGGTVSKQLATASPKGKSCVGEEFITVTRDQKQIPPKIIKL